MDQNKPNPIFRVMPSLTDVAFLMPLVFLFTRMEGVRTMLSDCDTGWHIRTGEWILANGRIPDKDMFSFTMPGQPWYAWEWLWEVGAALLHQRWGLAGVVLPSIFIVCLTFALLYRLAEKRCGNPLVAISITILATAGSTIHWLARPHLFTMLFLVVFLIVLDRAQDGRVLLLWWLPAITVVWTNLHGGFAAGIVVVGAYAGGELLRAVVASNADERKSAFRGSLPYLAAAAGCLAASFVNPYFYHLHTHIWEYLRDPYQSQTIQEFQSANFQGAQAIFFEAMLLLGAAAAIWDGLNKRFTSALLVVGWGHLALITARNIPIFMIVMTPVVVVAIVAWLKAFRIAPVAGWLRRLSNGIESTGAEMAPVDNLWRTHVVCALAMVAIWIGMASPGAGKMLKPEFDEKVYPTAALPLLERPGQRIFTGDEWGDYLIYKLAPKGGKVFVDGRSDFYGGKFGRKYMDIVGVKYNWEQLLSQFGVDTILLPPDAALASTVKESSHWRVVYDDGLAIVFRQAADAARGEQVSTSSTGGRERDLLITQPKNVISKDHETQSKGAL